MNRDVAVYDYLKLLNDMNFKGILKISVSVNWQLYKKYNNLIMKIVFDYGIWYVSYKSKKVTASVQSSCSV